MNALRLAAVYGGSCGAVLFLAHRFLLPLSRRAGGALVLLPLVLTGRAIATGGFYGALNIAYASAPLRALAGDLPKPLERYENGYLSDVAIQMIPWRKAVRESIRTGHPPLWNRFMLSGDVLLASSQPAVFHPAVWLGFLLPLATAWTFSCAFTLFLAAVFAFLYLREIGTGEPAAFFGAAAWMLSDGLVTLQGWPNAYVLSALPLLALGLRRLAGRMPGGLSATTLALVAMIFGGHPETLLLGATGAGVLFLFELARAPRPFVALSKAIVAGATALALTAVLLLPFVQALSQTMEKPARDAVYARAKKSVSIEASVESLFAIVYPRAYDHVPTNALPPSRGFLLTTYASVGSLALALATVGATSRRREARALLTAGGLAALVAVGFPVITELVTRLPLYRIAIYEYSVGVTLFSLSSLAALGYEAALDPA